MKEAIQSSKEWLEYAQTDWQAAIHLTTATPKQFRNICYHCEQAAEKALKGFLTLHEVNFRHTHDLVQLCMSCMEIDPSYQEIAEGCSVLTGYGTQMRYPSGIDVDETETREALAICEAIIGFIEQSLDIEQGQEPQMSM